MKSYKVVKRRIMALLLAAVMMLSSITISTDARAESVGGVSSGGAIAQVFEAQCSADVTYVELKSVTLKLQMKKDQWVNCSAKIHRNLTGDNPYSDTDIVCNTKQIATVSATEDGTQTITIEPSDKTYLTDGEKYSVVVSFTSNMDIAYLKEVGTGAYVKNLGETYWGALDNSVMAANYENVVGSPTGERFNVSLSPAKVCVDKNDAKNFTFQAALTPAYQRTVKYTVSAGAPFTVNNAGEVSFSTGTPVACGSWTVTASVDGAEGSATAKVTVVEASLNKTSYIYSGEACMPEVQVSDGTNDVDLTNFDIKCESNNVAAGDNAVIITGKNDYEGYSRRLPFKIQPLPITQSAVNKGEYKINAENDTVTEATITVDGVKLVCNSERRDFKVEAQKTGSTTVGGKLNYTYTVKVTGQGNSSTEGSLETTVNVPVQSSGSGKIDISKILNIELDSTNYTYTGREIKPDFTATLAGSQLTESEINAIVDVKGSVDASKTATVTFTGKGNYTGTITKTFVINQRRLDLNFESQFELYVEPDAVTGDYTYISTGDSINPEVTLKYNNGFETVVLGSNDYSVEYRNCTYPGQMTIRITGKGNFSRSHNFECTIVGNLKKDVIWSIEGYEADEDFNTGYTLPYTGDAQTVELEGSLDGEPLELGIDFSVEYRNNTDVGTAEAIITGMDDYAGQEVTLTYEIEKAPLSGDDRFLWINPNKTWTYTGNLITLSSGDYNVRSRNTGKDLRAGTDYELSYESDHTNAGTVKVTATAKGNYEGSLSGEFTILPRDISVSDTDLTVKIESPVYNGFPQKPLVTLSYNGKELNKSDYSVSATDNVKIGTGKVTITGKNNLTGEKEDVFTILPRELKSVEWNIGGTGFNQSRPSGYKTAYTGIDQRPSIELRDGDTKLVKGEDYDVKYRNNTNPGTAHIDVTWKNGYESDKNIPITIDFVITKKDISADNAKVKVEYIENKPKDANGKVFPKIKVVDEGLKSGTKTLVEGTDYEIVESTKSGDEYNLKTAGAPKKAVVKGHGDYYEGELEVSYSIGKNLETGDYYVRMMDPHTDTEVLPTPEDGITRFFYLGEGEANRPIPKLYYKNPTTNAVTDVTANTEITYTSSLGAGANINSVNTPSNPNVVTVSFKGTGDYYGVVSAEYLLRPTGIGGENNAVIEVASTLGAFNDIGTACEVPYTGYEIGLNQIKNDLKLTYKFQDGKIEPLTLGTDYRLEVKTGSDLKALNHDQSVTVIAYGQGNYNGSKEFTYKIVKRNLSDCYVPANVNNKTINYTGEPILPYTEVYDSKSGRKLTPNVDYVVAFSDDIDIINSGTKEYKIVGNGNYTGELTTDRAGNKLQYTIKGKLLNSKTVRIENFHKNWTFTGDEITQDEMSVIYTGDGNERALTENVDYTVTYSDLTGPGTVTMTITGKGAYEGTVVMKYDILENMSAIRVEYNRDKKYIVDTKGSIQDSLNETDFILINPRTTQQLKKGDDYTIDVTECNTPGVHNLIFRGIGKYTGQTYAEIKLYGDLSKADVKGVADSYVYTGLPVGPESVVVSYGEDNIISATNYTIEETNNTAVGDKTATLTISPKDGTYYVNHKVISYSIFYDLSAKSTQVTIDAGPHLYKKDGVKPGVTVTYRKDSTGLTENTDYTVEYSGNDKAGTAYVIIKPVNGRSINSQRVGFEIKAVDISTAGVNWKTEMPNDELEYNGKEQKPEVEVITTTGETLTKGVDYDVIYKNNKNVGSATVRIVGRGNYTGDKEKTFTITQASLDPSVNAEISYTVEDIYYNNGPAQPKISVMFHGNELKEGVDYYCELIPPTGVAPDDIMYPTRDISVKFTPNIVDGVTPNFKDTYTKGFEIKAINLNDRATVTLKNNTVEYTGKEIPEENLDITVECKMVGQTKPYTLKKNKDYTITITDEKDIIDVGTYKIKVVGTGGFTGSWDDLEFKVTPRDLVAHTKVELENENMPYNDGEEVKPSVTVTEDGEGALLNGSGKPVQLEEGTDYVVSYENNRKSASGSDPDESNRPTVIITGKGNYAGTIKENFNIGTSIEKAVVSLDVPAEGFTYDGKEHKPDLVGVYLDGDELKPGTDYELITEPDEDFTDAGEKNIKIKGIGEYYGTAFGTYTIKKSAATDKIKIELGGLNYNKETKTYSATYTGSAIVPTVTVYDEAISKLTPLVEGDDYTVSVLENVNAGKAFVYVDISKNYTGEDKQRMTFEILPRNISEDFNLILNKNKYEYEDSAIIPDIKVVSKLGISPSVELEESDEYTISSLSNNVNAGIAKVTVAGVGNYTGTLSGEFMILAALDDPKPDFTSIEIAKQFYMGEEVTPDVKIHCGGNDLVQEVDFHVENKWSKSDPYRGTVIITSKKPYYTCKEPIVLDYTLAYGSEYLKVTGFASEYTYTRSEIKPSFKITDLYGKEMDAKKLHYDPRKITYKNLETGMADCINVGTIEATIPVSVDGQDEILLRAVYRIIPKNINDCSITKVNKNTYNGTAIEPAVAIVYNGHELTKNREFAESYANNINPGTATVVLQGRGNYTGQCSMHFKVEPAGMIKLTAKPASQSSIRIGWARNAKVTGYEIYSANGKKKYGTTTKKYFVVKGLKSATKYTFKVRSYVKVNGVKTYGESKKVTAYTEVAKVSASVKSRASGTATLKWKKQASIGGYQVYRSTKSKGKYKKIATVPKAYGSYTDKKVKSGKTYYYKVRAYKRINGKYSYGDFSKKIKVTIK